MYTRSQKDFTNSRGLTLIELIAVISIMTLLSAIALPTLRAVMSQRKTSQASILVKNMMEAARARAIARGRPVAVVLERLSSRATRDPNDSTKLVSQTASATDYPANYEAYNTCIRLSLAETPPPISFEGVQFNLSGNQLTLNLSVLNDSRYLQAVRPGSIIEFPEVPAIHRRLMVVSVDSDNNSTPDVDGSGNPVVLVDNFGSIPATLKSQVDALILARHSIHAPISNIPATGFSAGTKMLVQTLPQPVPSMIVDMPKGTCVDLSLSGFASDTRWTSPVASVQRIINLRDTRRHFASDWIVPNIDPAGQPNNDPSPESLRPVYIVFGANGVLESILMNGISGTSGLPQLNKYDAHEDVYLFVGRTDQITRMTGFATTIDGLSIAPDVLEAERIKTNINDSSCEWVKVSPRSGTISVASAARYNEAGLAATTSIGQVLYQSRMFSFTDAATAQ